MVPAGTRLVDYDGTFFEGVKSDSDPSQLPVGYAWQTVNMINIGGLLSCRPGYSCVITLPDGNLQGMTLFRPIEGYEMLVVAVDGVIYVSSYPFDVWKFLPNILFSSAARKIYWASTVQSAQRIGTGVPGSSDDLNSEISVIPPKAVLFMQDGGLAPAAWFDGSLSGQIVGDPYNTPSGGPICWSGNRMWVGVENRVYASDISNPFSFREQIYLGGASFFGFADIVTAMTNTPSVESPQLMVFTGLDASILQSNIQDRSTWNSTTDFQEQILQIGCVANRSLLNHFGRIVWFSPAGMAFYDPALSGKITSRLPTRDNEMLSSKIGLSDDLSGVCGGVFGQFLLMSVPFEDTFNAHTWALNHASLSTLQDDSGPSWSGIWTGTRPVEWAYGQVAGIESIFHVSVDADGKNRLWQAFNGTRLDNGCPITWAFFSRGYFGQTDPIQDHPPGSRCRLAWTDISFAGIEEDLNLGVFYAPDTHGSFRSMMNKTISVQRGSLSFDQTLTADSVIFPFKAQSRVLRTEDVNQQSTNPEESGCGVEDTNIDNIARSFQVLVVGHGPATIRWTRPVAFSVPEDFSGSQYACIDETGIRAVRYDGMGVNADTLEEVIAQLANTPQQFFQSNQTVTVDQSGFIAVGVGAAQSMVSQEAADRVATIIATKQAEFELESIVPPITSVGLGLEDVG
jgi:hypothetical protein